MARGRHIRRLWRCSRPSALALSAVCVAVAVAVLFLVIPGVARATVLEPLNLEKLSARATTIVVAKTTGVSAQSKEAFDTGRSGAAISTIVELTVQSVVKGSAPASISVSVPGGRAGGVDMVVEGMPEFEPGETVLLFLDKKDRVIGGWQGKMTVKDGVVQELGLPLDSVRSQVMAVLSGAGSPKSTGGLEAGGAQAATDGQASTASGQPAPVITSISPGSASAGTGSRVTINGTGFGTDSGSVLFFYKSGQPKISGPIISWSDTAVVTEVPVGTVNGYQASACCGPVTVTNSSGVSSVGYDFLVTFGYGQMKWSGSKAGFFLNANCADTANERTMATAAAATWSSAANFSLYHAGICSTKTFITDGYNDVFWSSSQLPTGVLAATSLRYSGSSIVEIDTCFNDSYTWGDGSGGTWDVQSVALHEFGHWLTLRDLYGSGDSSKVMYGVGSAGVQKRSLTDSDRQGIVWIYGNRTLTCDQTDRRLKYTGVWSSYANRSFAGGSYSYSNAAGSTVTATFSGTRLDLIATEGPAYGLARVIVDGGAGVMVDLYSSAPKFQQAVYSTGDLANGVHTVKIICTGYRNDAATGTYVDLDALKVTGSLR